MKRCEEFTITRRDFKDMLKVRIYKTNRKMMNGCARTCKYCGYKPPGGIYNGVWIPTPDAKCEFTGRAAQTDMFGIILLNEEHLTADIIAHECLHAAFTHSKYINHYKGNYNDTDYEENFVQYFQDLFETVLFKLREAGYKIK